MNQFGGSNLEDRMKKGKRNLIVVAVLLFVCAAVWLNWSYNKNAEPQTPDR